LSPTSVAAQTLVQDTKGKVEAINIRTIRLRDDNGSVHTIPYSSVTTITNMSRDFSRWMIEAAVAYREDVDSVLETLKGSARACAGIRSSARLQPPRA
jgi:moderate conductance mechanosensitive channel